MATGCQLFGSDSDDPMGALREQVAATVNDEERAAAMMLVVDKIDDKLREISDVVAGDSREAEALFADYDSTRAEFETLFARSVRERRRLQKSLLELHVEFKSHLDDDEWDVLLPAHARAVTSRVDSLIAGAVAGRGPE